MSQASSSVSLNLGVSNARHLRQERHRSGAVTSRPSIRALADTVPCSARRRWGLPASPLQGHSCPPCRWETLAFWAVRSDFTNPASHDAVGFSAASARLPRPIRQAARHCRAQPCRFGVQGEPLRAAFRALPMRRHPSWRTSLCLGRRRFRLIPHPACPGPGIPVPGAGPGPPGCL